MGNQAIQPSLTGGELAPGLWARVDMARYQTSLKTCRNFVVQPYGGAKNRAGTKMVCEVKDSTKRVRLLPFAFNSTQTYVMEFGDGYARFVQNGGQVVGDLPSAWDQGTIYYIGDLVTAGPNGANHNAVFSCLTNGTAIAFPEDNLDLWYALSNTVINGQEYFIVETPTPYGEADLPMLKYTQSADVVTIAHPSYPPKNLSRLDNDHWKVTSFKYKNGPFQAMNSDENVVMSVDVATGTATVTCSEAKFTTAHVGLMLYLEQKDFGVPWEVGKTIAIGDIRRSDGKYFKAASAGTTGSLRPTNTEGNWSDGGVIWTYLHDGSGWGIILPDGLTTTPAKTCKLSVVRRLPDALIVSVGSSQTVSTITYSEPFGNWVISITTAAPHGLLQGDVINYALKYKDPFNETQTLYGSASVIWNGQEGTSNFSIDIASGRPGFVTSLVASGSTVAKASSGVTSSPSWKWALGAWGESLGYPSCVTYHQQRIVFGATTNEPRGIWTSRTGDFLDFGRSTPIQDDDPITNMVASTRMDTVKALHPMEALIVMTQGASWAAGSGQSDILTPANMAFKNQGYCGASDLPVIGVGNTALFVQDKGQVIRDLAYEFATNTYSGNDLTVPASHLLEGHTITEWAYQQNPFRCVWMVRDDGVLLSMTYMREQQVIGWARHDTDGKFESVCVVGEGSEDVVYVVVKRTINGQTKRFVERMESRMFTDLKYGFFVDCGLIFDNANTNAALTLEVTGGTNWDETENLTVTASDDLFVGASDVDDVLTFWDGDIAYRLRVVEYVSATEVKVAPNRFIPEAYRETARSDWEFARNTFSIPHLEGKTVSIFGDGNVYAQQVVTGGIVTIDPPASRVHIGLPIQGDLETLDLSIPGIETLLPKTKAIPSVTFVVQDTQTIMAGRTFDRLSRVKTRQSENYDQPIAAKTGKIQVRMDSDWSKSANVCLRVDDPIPVTILAVIPEVTVGGA